MEELREVKLEDFDANLVKEEPPDEQYVAPKYTIVGTLKRKRDFFSNFAPIIEIEPPSSDEEEEPIFEGAESLEEVKIEPLDYEEEAEPKLLEEVKKEPMDNNFFSNFASKIVEIEPQSVEELKLLEEVKKEPMEEAEPSEPCSRRNFKESKIEMETLPERYSEDAGLSGSDPYPYCCLCGIVETPHAPPLKIVPVKSELLILATGLILAARLPLERARHLMTRRQTTYSCQEHYRDADEHILRALKVEHSHSSKTPMMRLMVTVNAICPQMSTGRFCELFPEFHDKHIHREKRNRHTVRCNLCNYRQIPGTLMEVSHKVIKYFLALSSVLHGYRDTTQARRFASRNVTRRVCRSHHKSTLSVILEKLEIRNVDKIPSDDNFISVLNVMEQIWSGCTPTAFRDTLRWFATTIQNTDTVTTPPLTITVSMPKLVPKVIPVPTICFLCSATSPNLQKVKVKDNKLVLVVAACLSSQHDKEWSKTFMSGNAIKLVCPTHFSEAFSTILAALQISNLQEAFPPPSQQQSAHVINLVQEISSSKIIGYDKFIEIVHWFRMSFLDNQ